MLEMGLINWTLSEVMKKGFTPLTTPEIVRSSVVEKCGFQPRGANTQVFEILAFLFLSSRYENAARGPECVGKDIMFTVIDIDLLIILLNIYQVYSIEGSDQCLIGTAEIPVGGIHMDSIVAESLLPLKYVAFSHCFRTEAGAAGTATR